MSIFENITRKAKQHLVGLKLREYDTVKQYFLNKTGIEIGGPSAIFKSDNLLPVYPDAHRIDGVNFSTLTVWENKIDEGLTYSYEGKQKGYQLILEASDLHTIEDNRYDFLLSSHSLEHCANVIKTLKEWKRVLVDGGIMVIVLPNKIYTFDHKRSITSFSHLVDDYQSEVDESDLTHLEEIVSMHDLNKDPGIVNKDAFLDRSLKNFENRCLHHHVFDVKLMKQLFEYVNMDVITSILEKPHHIILIAQKKSVSIDQIEN